MIVFKKESWFFNILKLYLYTFILLTSRASAQPVIDPDLFHIPRFKYMEQHKNLQDTFVFDDVKPFYNNKAFVKIGDKWGVLSIAGRLLFNPYFDDVKNFISNIAAVKIGTKWSILNYNLDTIANLRYDNIEVQADNCIIVRNNNKYGIINSSGEIVVKIIYDYIYSYYKGLLCVKAGNKWGIFTATGVNISHGFIFDQVQTILAPVFFAKQDSKWFIFNSKIHKISSIGFDEVVNFSNNLALVKNYSMMDKNKAQIKVLDTNGQFVKIAVKYDSIYSWNEKYLWLKIKKKGWVFYNLQTNKEYQIKIPLDNAGPFYDNIGTVQVGENYAFTNNTGQLMTEFKYQSIRPTGLKDRFWITNAGAPKLIYMVNQFGKFIDTTQALFIQEYKGFEDGFCPVSIGSYWGLIDEKTKIQIPIIFDGITAMHGGKGFVQIENKWALASTRGRLFFSQIMLKK